MIPVRRFFCYFFVFLSCLVLPLVNGFSPQTCSTCTRDNVCKPPNCSCCSDHMPIVKAKDTPQMVFFTFDDAVTPSNAKFYRQLFDSRRKNPNGCPIKMTLFVSHENTVYNLVREFYTKGMEIGVHSVSHSHPSPKTFKSEAKKQKENISKMAKVPLSEIKGWRSPFLEPLGDVQPQSLHELDYMYDATLTVSKNNFQNPPIPFTLDYGWPYECKIKPCPKDKHRGFWEVPVVTLRDYLDKFDCVYVDGCHSPPPDEESAFQFLWNNFVGYYEGNRAPFGINMHASWFFYPDRLKAMDRFITKLGTLDDVYIITMKQVISWLKQPTSLADIKMFEPWGCANSTYLLQKRREKLMKEKERQRRIRLMKVHSQMAERHKLWQHQMQDNIRQQKQRRRQMESKVVTNQKHRYRNNLDQRIGNMKNSKIAGQSSMQIRNRYSRPSINWQRALRYQSARHQKKFNEEQNNGRHVKSRQNNSKIGRLLEAKQSIANEGTKRIKTVEVKLPKIRSFNKKKMIDGQKQFVQIEKKLQNEKGKLQQQILAQDESLSAQYLVEEKSGVGYAADENTKKKTKAKISEMERKLFPSSDVKNTVTAEVSHNSARNIKDIVIPSTSVDKIGRNKHKSGLIFKSKQDQKGMRYREHLPVIHNIVNVSNKKEKHRKNLGIKSELDEIINGRIKNQSVKNVVKVYPSTSTLPPIYVPSRLRTSTSGEAITTYDKVPDTTTWRSNQAAKVTTGVPNILAEHSSSKVTTTAFSNRHSEFTTTTKSNKLNENKSSDNKSSHKSILQSLFSMPGLKPLLKELMGYLKSFPDTYLKNIKAQNTIKSSKNVKRDRATASSISRSTTTSTESTTTSTESTTTATESTTTTTESTTTLAKSTTTLTEPTTKPKEIVQSCQQGINCMSPNCFCKSSEPPGGLRKQEVPQIVYLTIEGPVNFLSFSKVRSLFTRQRTNPNGCRISGTLFVSDTGTSYSLTNLLKKDGLEISLKGGKGSTANLNMENFQQYLLKLKNKVEKYGFNSNLQSHGWRNFNLTSLSNNHTAILRNMDMYDSSLVNSDGTPIWPFTLGTDHICSECPDIPGKGVWEIPMTPLEHNSRKCLYADSCEPRSTKDTFKFLMKNFEKYSRLHIPFGINLKQNWFRWENHGNLAGLSKFIDFVLQRNNVFIISVSDMLQWIKNPVPMNKINSIIPWKC